MNALIGTAALYARAIIIYPLIGMVAGYVGFIEFNPETRFLVVDVDAASTAIAGLIWGGGSLATFAWSRIAQRLGGAT